MDKRKGNPSAKPLIGMILGIAVLIAAAYFAFSGNEPKKPVWNANDRSIPGSGSESSGTESNTSQPATPSTATESSNSGTTEAQPGSAAGVPSDIANTPAGRDARDSESPSLSGSGSGAMAQSGTTASGATEYWNSALNYGFSLPKSAYFMGTGPRNGAAHSIAIRMGTGVTDFDTADYKVWYYPKELLPQVSSPDTGFYQDIPNSRTYLKLGSGTLMIEGDVKSGVVNMIIQTAHTK